MSELASKDIKFIPGVGPKKAELLKSELNVTSVEDMLYVFPYRYIDRSKFYKINDIDSTISYVQIRGRISSVNVVGKGRGERMSALFSDGTDSVELVWFKGVKYMKDKLKPNQEYVLFGKPNVFNGKINFVHPDLDPIEEAEKKQAIGGLQGLYNTTEKMKAAYLNNKGVQKIIGSIFETQLKSYQMPETLPAYILQRNNLTCLDSCIRTIHYPKDNDSLNKAQFRLKFEELFYIQLEMLHNTDLRSNKYKGFVFGKIGNYFNTFYKRYIPFELTDAQKRVIKEIREDTRTGRQMNRLLQGDVGSGKTLVAVMCMLIALDNGFQACLMAPTEILAEQHFENISQMLQPLGVNVRLLTGSTKTADRRILHAELQSGEAQIVIGTHALIEEKVKFFNLGLAIIDEQHRFGVAQRAQLWQKNSQPPHILVMTATPIPRTLAMTLYGDLDVSVIDQLPPGRHPIQTLHRIDNKRVGVYDFIKRQIALGRQAYIVYPLIKESEKLDFENLEKGYGVLKQVFAEPEYHLSMVHGQLPAAEKEKEMQRFARGDSQILVATTVIEVGVNVPNATVMVIESAERFGLSQLHQLRGRVGRGGDQSYCILITSGKLSSDSRKRMQIMTSTTDGFQISEEDLKMRGPGDLEGTQQSGTPLQLKIANLATDGQILQYARDMAKEILKEDPQLSLEKNVILKRQLKNRAPNVDWGAIS
jgi:ATP-dependent DNA helicase RecG